MGTHHEIEDQQMTERTATETTKAILAKAATSLPFSDTADFSLDVREPTSTELAYRYWYVFAIALLAIVLLVRRSLGGKKKDGKK